VRDKRDSKEITSRLLRILSVDFLDVNESTNDLEHAAFVTRERHRMETSNGPLHHHQSLKEVGFFCFGHRPVFSSRLPICPAGFVTRASLLFKLT